MKVNTASELKWYGDEVMRKMTVAGYEGLFDAGDELMTASNVVIPIDTHALGMSGRVSGDPVGKEVAVSYDKPYAVVQHERLDYRHKPGRKAKYLEGALNETARSLFEVIARPIRILLGA